MFEKSWEYGKDLFACFVNLKKACDRVLRDKLQEILREYVVDGQLWYVQVFLLPTGGLCSGKWQAIKAVLCARCTPARMRFVTSPLHCWHDLNRQIQLSVPRLEIAK